MQRTILVTGASGFSGQHLIRYLKESEPTAILIGLSKCRPVNGPITSSYCVEINDQQILQSILSTHRPAIVFHLAVAMPPATPQEMWHTNVGGTVALLRAISATSLRPRILIVGSAAEYLPASECLLTENAPVGGTSEYGMTKWAQTKLAVDIAKESQIDLVMARTFNLIGPYLPETFVAGSVCAQVRNVQHGIIKVGNTASVRDFLDVRDAVRAYYLLATNAAATGIYNVCSGNGKSIEEMLQAILRIKQGDFSVEHSDSRMKSNDIDFVIGCNKKIAGLLDWAPTFSLEESITDMLRES